MRVLVDTSAWVDFLNGHPSPERKAVADLIAGEHVVCSCGVVVAEVFHGLKSDKGRDDLADLFREMDFLEPRGIDLYLEAAKPYRDLRGRGITIRSTIDCLIAVLAEANRCWLLARDADLGRIVDSGLVDVRRWPPSEGPPTPPARSRRATTSQ